MGNTYNRVFTDSQVLDSMLEDYARGHSLKALGRKYGVTHSTILFWVKRAGVWEPGRTPIPDPNHNYRRRPAGEAKSGNEKYKKLIAQEQEWLHGASLCKVCDQFHPPHKSDQP